MAAAIALDDRLCMQTITSDLVIRPIALRTENGLPRHSQHLSEDTRRRRFGGLAPAGSARVSLDRLTDVDHHEHEALAAVTPSSGRIVGVARYIALPETPEQRRWRSRSTDGWQGRGVGRRLMRRLAERARDEGITRMLAYVGVDNRPVLGWLGRAGGREGGTRRRRDRLRASRSTAPARNGGRPMIATAEQYAAMLDAASAGGYALAAVNVTSSETLNGALRGFAEAGADGIVQVTTGAAEFLSGAAVEDMALGARALAEYARVLGERYPVLIALHTDHAPPDRFDAFVRPLIDESRRRRRAGRSRCFTRTCSTARRCRWTENLRISRGCSKSSRRWVSCSRSRAAWSAARRTASPALVPATGSTRRLRT